MVRRTAARPSHLLEVPTNPDPTLSSLVLVHGVVLASVETGTPFSAYKLAAELALEALDADPTFMATHCDCLARYEVEREARIQAKKDRRKEVRKQRLQEAEQDSAAVDELLGLDDEPLAESDDGGH